MVGYLLKPVQEETQIPRCPTTGFEGRARLSCPHRPLSENERGAIFVIRQGYLLKEAVPVSAGRRGKPWDPRALVTRRLVSW